MAVQTNVKVIIDAQDNASSVLRGFGDQAKKVAGDIELDFKGAGLAAVGFLGSLSALAAGAISVASSFEQNRISFETMLGSAEAAKKMMQDLAKFTLETPFEMTQVTEGAKKLLAYGISAEEVIPKFKMLGDIAAGVGMDKLPQLILAFGQVKAATKLTGMELRQFTEAGVPMLEALVNQANEAGGVLTKMGGASSATAKKAASLSASIADAEWKMNYFKQTGGKTDKQLQSLQATIDMNKKKLGEFGPVGVEVYGRVKVAAKDMIEKISDGAVSFQDVSDALAKMTGEGGKFENLMLKQSMTFGGLMSNIRDKITQTMSGIAGVSAATGETREGSLFAVLKDQAEKFYKLLDVVGPKLVQLTDAIAKNETVIRGIAGVIGGLLVAAGVGFVVAFGPAVALAGAFAAAGGVLGVAMTGLKGNVKETIEPTEKLASTINDAIVPAFVDINGTIIAANQSFGSHNDIVASTRVRYDELGKNVSDFQQKISPLEQWITNVFKPTMNDTITVIRAFGEVFSPAVEQTGQLQNQLNLLNIPLTIIMATFNTFLFLLGTIVIGLRALGAEIAYFFAILSGNQAAIDVTSQQLAGLQLKEEQLASSWWNSIFKVNTANTSLQTSVTETNASVMKNFNTMSSTVESHANKMYSSVDSNFSKMPGTTTKHGTDMIVNFSKAIDDNKSKSDAAIGAVCSSINGQLSSTASSASSKGQSIVDNLVNGIKDKARALKNNPFGNFLLNMAGFGPYLQYFQTGGIVPGPIGAAVPIMAHAGEQVIPSGLSGSVSARSSGGSIVFEVNIGLYAGTETEKRSIARDLYAALVQVAQSQNKTVQELMGA